MSDGCHKRRWGLRHDAYIILGLFVGCVILPLIF